jgi:hypothetical protein
MLPKGLPAFVKKRGSDTHNYFVCVEEVDAKVCARGALLKPRRLWLRCRTIEGMRSGGHARGGSVLGAPLARAGLAVRGSRGANPGLRRAVSPESGQGPGRAGTGLGCTPRR